MSRLTEVNLPILVKLGSIAVHAEELLSDDGNAFDRVAIKSLLDDPDVKGYLATLDAAGFLPKKRRG